MSSKANLYKKKQAACYVDIRIQKPTQPQEIKRPIEGKKAIDKSVYFKSFRQGLLRLSRN